MAAATTVAGAWGEYLAARVPEGAGIVRVEVSREAFHAGFLACYEAFREMALADAGEEAGATFLDGLDDELRAFVAEVNGRS